MPNVHGIDFNANQAELVKDIVRELLKNGNCAVYAVSHIKPNGELRMASTPPKPGLRGQHGVFLRIRPGTNEATLVRPMNAKGRRATYQAYKVQWTRTLGSNPCMANTEDACVTRRDVGDNHCYL
jgi:hypothetical protein